MRSHGVSARALRTEAELRREAKRELDERVLGVLLERYCSLVASVVLTQTQLALAHVDQTPN